MMKWAPIPRRTGAPRRLARTTASTTARKSFADRYSGSPPRNARSDIPFRTGDAKPRNETLLFLE